VALEKFAEQSGVCAEFAVVETKSSEEMAHRDPCDGAVGIQISQPIGKIIVQNGVETFGGTGPSLVKGIMQELAAVGSSVKSGGSARAIFVHGGLKTHRAGVSPLEQDGSIESSLIEDGFNKNEQNRNNSRSL
jgi:hypothetical protein